MPLRLTQLPGHHQPKITTHSLIHIAPNDVIKPDMVMPFYALRPGQYKEVSNGKRY
jgi:hypothetical protein